MKKLVIIVSLLTLVVNCWAVKIPTEPYYRYGEISDVDNAILSTGVQIHNNSTLGTATYNSCYFPNGEGNECANCCTGIFDCEVIEDPVEYAECDSNYGKCMTFCKGVSLPLDASVLCLLVLVAAYVGVSTYRRNVATHK